MTLQLNLDTRRDAFAVTLDLDEAGPLVPLIVFEAPDDLRRAAALSLVSLEARASHRAAGWADGEQLSERITLQPRGRAVLAVSRDWLAERVAVLRAHGDAQAAAIVELPFSTILELPRAPRASGRRIARITVTAGASQPVVSLEAGTIEIDDLPASVADRLAIVSVVIPEDIVFESNRSLVLETICAGLPGQALSLDIVEAPPGAVRLDRLAPSAVGARHRLAIERPEAAGGQRLRLGLRLERQALLGALDGLLAAAGSGTATLRLDLRATGWGDGSAAARPGEPDRRFLIAPPPATVNLARGDDGSALLAIADATYVASFGGETHVTATEPLRFEFEPEAANEPVRFSGLKVGLLRWPLGRTGTVEVEAEATIAGEMLLEPLVDLTPRIEREGGRTRHAQALMPLSGTIRRLTGLVRAGRPPRDGDACLKVTLSGAGRRLLTATVPIRLDRAVHRQPICIDLGASAISIWAGPARGEAQAFDLKPLPIGAWLAAHVDPAHDEAAAIDGEAAMLIPSHVGLDPSNNLRSDHAPHALRFPAMIGPGREAARSRMAHFGRRYDVSVPAPPPAMRGRAARRVAGLKQALAGGRPLLALAEPVNRYDAATGKVSAVSAVEVAPLVADVLDELVDLYVMRLCPEADGEAVRDPPPVAPRIIVTCPSGIAGEVEARYGAALGLFAQRLERLYPGVSAFADAAVALPEAVAAARYAADLLAPEIAGAPGEPAFLVTLDIGASTSDVAVARVTTQAGRLQRFEALTTFGIPAGGEAIDAALAGLITPLVDRLVAGGGWLPAYEAADLARALASDEIGCVGAQQWFGSALRRGKAALCEALLAVGGAYAWAAEGPTLDILLASCGPDGVWRGLCRPGGSAAPDGQRLGEHAEAIVALDAEGGRRLMLKLGRRALEGESDAARRLARTVASLGVNLQRMARAAVPTGAVRPKVHVVPTGRGALWPPLFEALAGEAARGRDAFPLQRPLAPTVMKKAVVAGAALLAGQTGGAAGRAALRCPLGIAVMGAHLAEGADGSLRTGAVAERVLYLGFGMAGGDRSFAAEEADAPSLAGRADLGQRFQFVRAAPGLDPQGRMLSELRLLLGHQDPVAPLEGEASVEARAERIDRFGICELESRTTGPDRRRVTITARDRDWQGVWEIEGDRVARIA
jgi:hypothetical protein